MTKIKHHTKFYSDYNLIECEETDSFGNLIRFEEYDEFGNIILSKSPTSTIKYSYVRFSNIETKTIHTFISYVESDGYWCENHYYSDANGNIIRKWYNSNNEEALSRWNSRHCL